MADQREEARLEALYQLQLLDTPPSEAFDRITRMASQIFGLPIAAVSLTDRDRQWFKSRVGVEHTSIPREKAPCGQVAESNRSLIIEDLLADPCYADSILARSGTRFYAGAPLITREGFGLGALCVLGTEPRKAAPAEMAALDDLAAIAMAQIELQHAFGRIDPVSGLATRNQFREDILDLERDRGGEKRIVVVIDLARDDQVSNMLRATGGARVDEMVREAARALRRALGAERTAYHVGATQFAFLSPANVEQSEYLARMTAIFDRLRLSSSLKFVATAAAGLRPFEIGAVPADDLLRSAASAAEDARSSDGAIALYSEETDLAHRRRFRLLRDFGRALEDTGQLHLVYQPRVSLETGRCVAVEALLRWDHPVLGDISPAEFIPIVERTTMAKATTQWVLDHSLDQLQRWHADRIEIGLSVNVSASNLAEPDLIQRIQLALLKRGLRPDQLEIELTESAVMDQPDQALAMLHELADAGVRLAVDDFGTGQSSLSYLQRLPADVVKIDQGFVRNLSEASGPDFVLVDAMISMAHKLGFRVVAEGVEAMEAAQVLARIGCEEAQGFLFARPMAANRFHEWLASTSDISRRFAGAA